MSGAAQIETDVLVVGAGPAGLAAAISARDEGADVVVVDENYDIGGHAMVSGGHIHLGGGHSLQAEWGIADDPDSVYRDWTDHHFIDTKYNDRNLVRVFADESAPTFEFLLQNGVRFVAEREDKFDYRLVGQRTVRRVFQTEEWPDPAGIVIPDLGRNGTGLMRAMERSARAKGVEIRCNHRFDSLILGDHDRSVVGAVVETQDAGIRVTTRRGVIIANGGSSGNVAIRRIFDPRLTEMYEHAGAPYSRQSGDGEMAAMSIGASLWGLANQGFGAPLTIIKSEHIGCRWGYKSAKFSPKSPMFDKARATGLTVRDWSDVILVNQRGRRFWSEDDNSQDFIDAALAGTVDSGELNGGGPIWAIFDAAAAQREGWRTEPPFVDPDGYFASGDTIEELAGKIRNRFQDVPIDGETLSATVARYNHLVDIGEDLDFGRANPRHRIETGPFHAAWATPIIHDCMFGLRANASCMVIDLHGRPIPGLFCAGESMGGFGQHGLARCLVFGRVAGRAAARQAS